jgi:hypothetical protein
MRASVLAVLLLSFGPPGQPLDDAVSAISGSDPAHLAGPCSDGEYLRRLSLDLLGYPPNGTEVTAFISDTTPDKRTRKLDEFLETPRFAEYWARRYAEVFFGNYHEPRFDINSGLTLESRRRLLTNFIGWFRDQIREERPWTTILTAMITARGDSEGSPEIAYKVSFLTGERQEFGFAEGIARHLMGVNLHCARCHDHPTDRWRVEDVYGLGAFNTRQKVSTRVEKGKELVVLEYRDEGEFCWDSRAYNGPVLPGAAAHAPRFLQKDAPRGDDRVGILADLLVRDEQKRWARVLANRTWAWLIGRGVVEPVDEFDAKHLPVSQALMNALIHAAEEGKGSLKSLVRTICSTETYQRSSESGGKCDRRHFCRGAVLPLTGEQMLNSIQVALRGAPGLDLQEAQELTAALTMRPQVGCEVHPLPCGTQHALMFRNSDKLRDWIRDSPVLAELRKTSATDEEAVDRMFLSALSRKATATETARFTTFLRDRGRLGFEDAYWTLMNTAEFLTRH